MVGKKGIFLLFAALLLAGCGRSATPALYDNSPIAECSTYADQKIDETEGAVATPREAAGDVALESEDAAPLEPQKGNTASIGNYFILTRDCIITSDSKGRELMYEYTCEPTFYSTDDQRQQWVDSILDSIHRDYTSNSSNLLLNAKSALEQWGENGFYSYANYQEIGIGRQDTSVTSLIVLSSVYSGGAHSGTIQTAWNLDLEQQKALSLEDVILESSAEKLAQLVQQIIQEKFQDVGEGALFADYEQTIAQSFSYGSMTPYWYFNEDGMVFFFNQYVLGPYAVGIIRAQVSYEQLEGILVEDYFPKKIPDAEGTVVLRSVWEDLEQVPARVDGDEVELTLGVDGQRIITVTVEEDGEVLCIGVEGQIFQVQLSEVSWLEGTAIGQEMLFSADTLTEDDVLEIVGGYDDESRSFAIEFDNGTGETVVYYIHSTGLDSQP